MEKEKFDPLKIYVGGRFRVKVYKDMKYVYIDFSNLKGKALSMVMDELIEFFEKVDVSNAKKLNKILMNCINVKTSNEIFIKAKKITSHIEDKAEAYNNKGISALFGLTKLQNILLNTVEKMTKSTYKAFNTKEEALEWLYAQN